MFRIAVAQGTIGIGSNAGLGHARREVAQPGVKTAQSGGDATSKGETLNDTPFRETGIEPFG